jgi:CheY-like chemotaxis protein
MPEKSPVLSTSSPSQAQILRFSVRDTGIGMSETLLPHLGEPFTQADGSTSRRFGGTGLGISICQRLLHQMGSHLEVRSAFGSGTEFSFDLTPLAADIPETAAPTLVKNQQWHLKRILIVDDNIVNQMLLKALLSKFATYIDLAADGSAALELFSQHHYDCVLMDCEMPVMDGFEATQAIRDKERRYALRPTPIIAQTGHALDEIRTRCFTVGMNDFITKPIQRERLLEVMQRLCPST